MLERAIRSQVNEGPVTTYEAGQSWSEMPGDRHGVSANASGLAVTVLDGYDKTTTISDYRWVIEEDRTFYVDPNCTTNPPPASCPGAASGIVPTFGVNFAASYMPNVAQGCTGPQSCESGQTVFNPKTGTVNVPALTTAVFVQ